MYPYVQGRVKKLRVMIINKDVSKYLARKNGNEILIWRWNNPEQILRLHKKLLVTMDVMFVKNLDFIVIMLGGINFNK